MRGFPIRIKLILVRIPLQFWCLNSSSDGIWTIWIQNGVRMNYGFFVSSEKIVNFTSSTSFLLWGASEVLFLCYLIKSLSFFPFLFTFILGSWFFLLNPLFSSSASSVPITGTAAVRSLEPLQIKAANNVVDSVWCSLFFHFQSQDLF